MSEEAVLRKLIVDGDFAGDDRRLISLLPHILQMLKDPESNSSLQPMVLAQLQTTETAGEKLMLISEMCERQLEVYQQFSCQIEEQIAESSENVQATKNDLAVARGIRENKEQYELLAKMIEKIPSRCETNMKLEAIRAQLAAEHDRQRGLELKLAERRNSLHVLGAVLSRFNDFLEEDGNDSEKVV